MMEAEIVDGPAPRVRLAHVRTLGLFGTALALLTMLAAFGFGFLVLFGTSWPQPPS